MRAEFDRMILERWLERGKAEEPEMWDYEVEHESAAEARERMTEDERKADAEWEKGRC